MLEKTNEVWYQTYDKCNDLQNYLDHAINDLNRTSGELRKIQKERRDWKIKLEASEIEKDFSKKKFRNCNCKLIACTN